AVPAYGPQNDVTLKMPAFEWVHVQLHQQKGMISLSPPTICNSAPVTICVAILSWTLPLINNCSRVVIVLMPVSPLVITENNLHS
ncbi:hypothetical protein, partial [Shigella flexneri]|uniref:hypothetical protein n=1 Tax=Shigella flexneri TaxID=623 RepID=UPI00374DD799